MPSTDADLSNRQADLRRVAVILRRRIVLILGCCLVAGIAAFVLSEVQTKEYSSSASLLFRNPGFAEDLFGSTTTTETTDPTREAATNQKLVGLKIVGTLAARKLPGLSPDEVSEMVSVSSQGQADVVSVTATSSDPAQAREVANTFARQFIEFRANTDRSKLTEAKSLAEKSYARLPKQQQQGVRGQALLRGAEKLGILASLQTGNAELVQPAELPTSPSSPKPVRNGIIGAFLGLILGLVLAFAFERFSRQIREPEEIEEIFHLPLLATIPESKAVMASNDGQAAENLPFAEDQGFQMLRASLQYFNVDREIHTVLITSTSAGVGKSTIAWNLARVAAHSARVLLLETDLRKPTIGRQHGLRMGSGLAELLTHQIDLDDAIQSKRLTALGNGNGSEATISDRSLDVIVAGSPPPNPAELLESQTMRDLHAQLRERYDFVVFDTAPVGVVSDAFPLLRNVDGVIVIARIGHSTRDHGERLREQLDRLSAPTLGVVANGVKMRRGSYYGYGGYYGEPAPRKEKRSESVGG